MKTNVSIESLKGPLGEFLLVNISDSDGIIGVCDTSVKNGICRKTFYAASESLFNIQYREKNNSHDHIPFRLYLR